MTTRTRHQPRAALPSRVAPGGPKGRPARTGRPAPRRPRRTRLWVTLGVAGAVLVLAVMATGRGGDSRPPAAPVDPAATTAGAATRVVLDRPGGAGVGDTAPAFSVRTTADTTFALPAGRPAVVFFMASWCARCYPEASTLAALDEEFGDRVAILAVSPDPSDSLGAIRRFATTAKARYGFIHDGDGTLARALEARSLDTTVVVDARGRIVFRDGVPTDEATLRSALTQAGLA